MEEEFYLSDSSYSGEESNQRIEPDRTNNKKDDIINSFEHEFEKLIEEKIKNVQELKDDAQFAPSTSKKDDDDLYDANKDDEDEQFVQNLNRSRLFDDKTKVESDATLNCPCCMSLLSLETQRHVAYRNQYRAMFTFNTKIDMDNPVEPVDQPSKKRRKNKHGQSKIIESNKELTYYPVSCAICSTEVGVYDSEEIYHFYNTIAGY